jgi:hypothetical protein
MTIYHIMDVVLYLWYYYVMFLLLSLNLIVLVKVFRYSFLVTMRKMSFLEVVSWREMAGMACNTPKFISWNKGDLNIKDNEYLQFYR